MIHTQWSAVTRVEFKVEFVAQPGDANRDREFNSEDILQVLIAGKYDTGLPATWEEGDWNGDGAFDQVDIVVALKTGNYLQGPYAARAISSTAKRSMVPPTTEPESVDLLMAEFQIY